MLPSLTKTFHNLKGFGEGFWQHWRLEPLNRSIRSKNGRIWERTREGLQAAKACGRVGGRPPALTAAQKAEARRMRDEEGRSIAEVARLFRVSRQTASVYKSRFLHQVLFGLAALMFPVDPAAMILNPAPVRSPAAAFGGGALIGTLGGLIGLGGAEFRLPLLLGPFRFPPLEGVILNKAMSLIVVATALPFRASAVPLDQVASHWLVIANLLAGSLIGAWFGAGWATRLRSDSLYRVIAVLMVVIAAVLLLGHEAQTSEPLLTGGTQAVAGIAAGFLIGIVASLMGVAGGELLIPTLVLLFGADIKLAGSLSLAVSLPTMLVGFARYSQDQSFAALGHNRAFVLVMAAGSVVGTFLGGLLLGIVPSAILLPILAAILLVSAWKMWGHAAQKS